MLALALFAQAVSAPPADFIKDHPSIVAWVIGILGTIVVAEAALLGAWVRTKFTDVGEQLAQHRKHVDENHAHIEERISNGCDNAKKRFDRIEERMDSVEKDLVEYREHVGAGDAELKRISDRMARHMDEEEKQVWGAVSDIKKSLADMKVENVEAHGNIIAGRTQLVAEVAALNARVGVIEPKVADLHRERPNGDFKILLDTLQQTLEELRKPQRKRLVRGQK